jgi:hypothetical protein
MLLINTPRMLKMVGICGEVTTDVGLLIRLIGFIFIALLYWLRGGPYQTEIIDNHLCVTFTLI